MERPPGSYTVTASAPGYRTAVEQVVLGPNTLKTLKISLAHLVSVPSLSRYVIVYVAAGLTATTIVAYVAYRRLSSAQAPQEI